MRKIKWYFLKKRKTCWHAQVHFFYLPLCSHFLNNVQTRLSLRFSPPFRGPEVLMLVSWPQPGRRWHQNVSCVTGGIRGAATFPHRWLHGWGWIDNNGGMYLQLKQNWACVNIIYILLSHYLKINLVWVEELVWVVIYWTLETDLPRALCFLFCHCCWECRTSPHRSSTGLFFSLNFRPTSYIPHFLHDVFFLIQLCRQSQVVFTL